MLIKIDNSNLSLVNKVARCPITVISHNVRNLASVMSASIENERVRFWTFQYSPLCNVRHFPYLGFPGAHLFVNKVVLTVNVVWAANTLDSRSVPCLFSFPISHRHHHASWTLEITELITFCHSFHFAELFIRVYIYTLHFEGLRAVDVCI